MVIPMPGGMGGGLSGEPPEAVFGHLQKIKWSVVAVFVAGVVSGINGGLPFNELCYCLAVVFLMKEDAHTGPAYRCLMGTPLSACAGPSRGGLTCLSPVMFLSGVNVLFSLFLGSKLFIWYNLLGILGQAVGCFYAYQTFKYLQGEAGPTGSLPGIGGGAVYNPPVRELEPRTDGSGPQTAFVAFAGEGNKLGAN